MNHTDLLKLLLPPVSYAPASTYISAWLTAEGNALDVAQGVADGILREADPATTSQLLPDWERNYGLPDACMGSSQDTQFRRATLLSKVNAVGGLSKAYFVDLAGRLGYTITISEFRVHDMDSDMDALLYDATWRSAFQVNSALNTIRYMTVDDSMDDAFATWSNVPLECTINRLKPAHTVALFSYT